MDFRIIRFIVIVCIAFCFNMAASNITNNFSSSTVEGEWYIEAGRKATYIAAFIIYPIYIILGSTAHCLTLKAYLIEARKEGAYTYQIYLTSVRLLWVLMTLLSSIPFDLWRSPTSPGPDWFRSCFICMWSMSHIGIFLSASCLTVCEMFSLLISADRFYALWKPVSYRVLNNRRKWTLAAFCVVVTILLNVAHIFQLELHQVTGQNGRVLYLMDYNVAPLQKLLGSFLVVFKNIFESILLVLLYVCNVGMLWFFRVRRIEASKKLLTTVQAMKRQEIEKTLALLAISQSICTTISVTYRLMHVALISFDPVYALYKSALHRTLMTINTVIMDLTDFVCVLAISKTFRKMIRSAMRSEKTNTIAPT